jgi:putative oxidoreductase
MMNGIDDGLILMARLFLATLFLIFGWRKLRDYPGTLRQIVADRVPAPRLAAAASIFMELPVAFAIAVGAFTRPAAILFVFYTLATSLAEHRYWAKPGAGQVDTMEAFYKNLSIMGGFLLLFVSGAGRYSVDSLSGFAWR